MIYNTDAWNYIAEMPDNSVDLTLTDPDYNHPVNMQELRRITRGHIIMFCKPENIYFQPDEYAFWVKPTSTKNYSKHLGRFVEFILIERQGETFNNGLHWSNYVGVYTDTIVGIPIHPWQKPYSLVERLLLIYSNPGDTVFDPFAGAGTTLYAALQNDRKALGCEIDTHYADIIHKNILKILRLNYEVP